MNFIKKYICELVFVANLFFIIPNHDFKIWWQRPIVNDAMGYYAYLPAIFIYHDLTYDFINEPWQKHYKDVAKDNPKDAFIVKFKGQEVNKYPPGVTYFQSPFFLIAHVSAKILGKEADGYSNIYMYFMCIGAIFWQYIFLKLLARIFLFYKLSEIALGFYTQIFGTYSHLYTLISISLFFYAGLKFFSTFPGEKSGKYFAWMALGFSLAIITRNINVIALLLLPCMGFKFSHFSNYLQIIKNKFAAGGLFISLLLIFSMFLSWKLQSGYWVVDSYPDEHFYWSKPQLFKSLFSAHKGWFVYTPLALVGLIGLAYSHRQLAVNFLAVLALVIYITSSWWCWDYGTAFSMRAYIDWYLFVAIGLGFLFHRLQDKKLMFYPVITLCILFSGVNVLQSEQFMRGIISGHSQGIEYSLKNFFRLRPILEYMISEKVTEAKKIIRNDFNDDKQKPFAEANEKTPFSKGMEIKLDEHLPGNNYNHIRYGATIKLNDLKNDVFLCASITNEKDSMIFWQQITVLHYVLPGESEKVERGFIIPPNIPANSKLKTFFWEPKGNTQCTIDDMYVEFMKATIE